LLALALPEFMSDPNNHFAMLLFYFAMLGFLFVAWRSKKEFLLTFSPPADSTAVLKAKHAGQTRLLEDAKNMKNWRAWRQEDNLVPDDADEDEHPAAPFSEDNDHDIQAAIQASLGTRRNPLGLRYP